MPNIHSLNSYHFDILKEVGNIGAGNAATALSRLLLTKIDMNVPSVKLVPFSEISDIVGGAEVEMVAIFLRVEGEASGSMMFLTSIEDAENLVSKLIQQPFNLHRESKEELGISALHELGNILAGSYLSAFSDFTQLSLVPTVPAVTIDMAGAIVNYAVLNISQYSDYVILVETEIIDVEAKQKPLSGQFFFIPDPKAFETIFTALGVTLNE
ncbi:chemotaxis protein CheC [Alkalihalobacillus trypoxylicola]|uniref:CheY-P-specific phosphatase CheC n=1 Tax=Alkalihalobacillus trypoxylicola TaxID=519424 RepID=A0A162F8G8_9BACI|nr:chemotaxis protein CheC [Alkalihalobacillus trypoxylicola]KYG35038.1 CheY-P-specific phosphatase CheC [Alkalihalobacillus trypoxylicola]GAF63692.1 chemotaxis protein CheC [Bacillus sp. TS-2]